MCEDELKELFKHLESQGAVVIVDQITEDGNLHIPLDLLKGHTTPDVEKGFIKELLNMARWALEHPSTSRFEYLSPERVKANKHLKGAFMSWWYAEHPNMTDAQRELFEDSVTHGLCPAGVVEHTLDGHHPIGWSWGSEWYLADYYLCLTRAIIQHAENIGNDVKSEYAPVYIAAEVLKLNRVNPKPEIVEAMGERLKQTEGTRPYGVVSGEIN